MSVNYETQGGGCGGVGLCLPTYGGSNRCWRRAAKLMPSNLSTILIIRFLIEISIVFFFFLLFSLTFSLLVVALSEDWFAKATTTTTTNDELENGVRWMLSTVCCWRWKWLICHNARCKGKCQAWAAEAKAAGRADVAESFYLSSAGFCFKVEQQSGAELG